jgi:hypothetical protein
VTFRVLKNLLPNRHVPTRIWRGPFRGARIVMNPRHSLRKAFGLYEHELNGWLEAALRRVDCVVDVGANDGYFTFGCAAAFRRLRTSGRIIAIEKQSQHIVKLRRSIEEQSGSNISFQLVQAFAGGEEKPGYITLDSLREPRSRARALIKIDVEGAEIDVINGGLGWIQPSNYFVIEVHREEFLYQLREMFACRGHPLERIDQRPLRFLGREVRDEANWWLVSSVADR